MAPSPAGTPCGVDPQLGLTVHRFDPLQRQCRCGEATTPDISFRKKRVHPKYASLAMLPTGKSWGDAV